MERERLDILRPELVKNSKGGHLIIANYYDGTSENIPIEKEFYLKLKQVLTLAGLIEERVERASRGLNGDRANYNPNAELISYDKEVTTITDILRALDKFDNKAEIVDAIKQSLYDIETDWHTEQYFREIISHNQRQGSETPSS